MFANFLIVGRWHAITRDQEAAIRRAIDECGSGKLVFVITACDQSGTKRHPLTVDERKEIIAQFASGLGREFEIHAVADIIDSEQWVEHLALVVKAESNGATTLSADQTLLISANADVNKRFEKAGYKTFVPTFEGAMPTDLLATICSGGDWQKLAADSALAVYTAHGIEARVRELFSNVLLTDDGELSTGRDFHVYVAGMDASLGVKIEDICPHVRPGRIVDKGCGSGSLLVHLSTLFPQSEIIGMDLSRELLRVAEGQHYPHHNVSVVKGNIIHQRFPVGTLSTVIFSSVQHEVYSYNGYDRDQVRLALRNTRQELELKGRVIIRDGVAPVDATVWMRVDAECEPRFYKFACQFKGKSKKPGVEFEERTVDGQKWFVLSLHDANEFLSKKDYLKNWDIEVNEEFGVFTLEQWRKELEASGYRVVEARSYLNPWILTNRYENRVFLHADAGDKPGSALQFPDTTAIIVGEAV